MYIVNNCIEILNAFFNEFANRRAENIKKLCTNDFLLIENGEIWDFEILKSKISELDHTYNRKNILEITKSDNENEYCSIIYYNKAEIIYQEHFTKYKWIENALFIKTENAWKIKIINSCMIESNHEKLS